LKRSEYIHRSKNCCGSSTASVVSGGLYAGASPAQIARLRIYGQSIGLAFQIVDDVLDVTQTSEQLGKSRQRHTPQKKHIPSLFGSTNLCARPTRLSDTACQRANEFGPRALP